MTEEQGQHLQQFINGNTPAQLGIQAPLWSRDAVRELIHREYDLWMPVRTVGLYLERWGYTLKKPCRHAGKQAPDEVLEWLEETYPEIDRLAAEEDATIVFSDECGVEADHCPRRGYSRDGERATMDVPDRHIRRNVISAVGNKGDCHFMTYKGMLDAAMFILFMKGLLTETKGKIYIIVDRLVAHDCAKVWDWADAHADRIDMFLLPRRSPEVNPDEYLNNDLKANVHKGSLPNNEEELEDRIHSFLLKLLTLPAHVMSYFQQHCVEYAAAPQP